MANLIHNEPSTALLTLTASGGTQTTPDQVNRGFRGIKVVVNVTAVSGGGSIIVTIQGKDRVSGAVYALLSSAAITTVTTNVYTVYPGVTATTNVSASDVLPPTWNIKAAVSAGNVTGTISFAEIM